MTHFAISPITIGDFTDYYPTPKTSVLTTKAGSKTILKLHDDDGNSLAGELDGWVTGLINENAHYTTCCIQMSHAINMCFMRKDRSKMVGETTTRGRTTRAFNIRSAANMEFRYIASVDEMKGFLDRTFETGERITSKSDIDDRPGIVVFMGNQTYGIHTEIWTGDSFHQRWMKPNTSWLEGPNVFFWSIGDPNLIDI
ncbi:MAG: hypothetical protein ISP49_12425 [Reyranella sp.]|nr:hypothetical protein [Reyranella sp.]MBL6652395.1 hypothetical protein [Reyranella sp.]